MINKNTYIFLGPTYRLPDTLANNPKVMNLPPVKRGDILALLPLNPKLIAIIDGYFHKYPSVLHKEILEALSLGIEVIGASSMGALRASELDIFGMKGIGKVYQLYASGELVGDDEVAILHDSYESEYKTLTYSLVNLRETLSTLIKNSLISAEDANFVINVSKSMTFSERYIQNIDIDLIHRGMEKTFASRVKQLILTYWTDIKYHDAKLLTNYVADSFKKPSRNTRILQNKKRVLTIKTTWFTWHTGIYRKMDYGFFTEFEFYSVARLYDPMYPYIHFKCLSDLILSEYGNCENDFQDEKLLKKWLLTVGISFKDLDKWLKESALTVEELTKALRIEETASIVIKKYQKKWNGSRRVDTVRALLSMLINNPFAISENMCSWYDQPPTSVSHINTKIILYTRNPSGSLPYHTLVTYVKKAKRAEKIFSLTKKISDFNSKLLKENPEFDLLYVSSDFLICKFLSNWSVNKDNLELFILNHGFCDKEDLVAALRYSLFYRLFSLKNQKDCDKYTD